MTHLARFVRIFVMAVMPGAVALACGGTKLEVGAVIALVAPALETAFRILYPADTAPSSSPSEGLPAAGSTATSTIGHPG